MKTLIIDKWLRSGLASYSEVLSRHNAERVVELAPTIKARATCRSGVRIL